MADVQRAKTSSPDWWAEAPAERPKDTYTDETGATALEFLAESLMALRDATNLTDFTLADAVRYLTEHVKAQDLVDTVAMIQDLKRTLGIAEAYVSRELGYLTQVEAQQAKAGHTSDGRPYEIKRGSIRKAWDHEGWQGMVRRAVVQGSTAHADDVVNAATGEAVDLYGMLAKVQSVHGSTAPKVKSLKALGIAPDDYCESSPGPYAVSIQQPSPTTTTTTGA